MSALMRFQNGLVLVTVRPSVPTGAGNPTPTARTFSDETPSAVGASHTVSSRCAMSVASFVEPGTFRVRWAMTWPRRSATVAMTRCPPASTPATTPARAANA